MQKNHEPWMELLELAAAEQDPVKLLDFVSEINRLMDEKKKVAFKDYGVNPKRCE